MRITTDGATLRLEGDLDVRSTTEVRAAVYDQLARHDHVVVDLSGVSGADVTALRVLAVASRAADLRGGHLTLRGCGPAVRRLLHLSHLIRVVDVDRAALGAGLGVG